MIFKLLRSVATLAGFAVLTCVHASAAVNLPPLNIDKTQTTVSGLSSGGYMAVQLHVAYSATFKKGAGIVAGGPFYCAQGSIFTATGPCMASPADIPISSLVATTNSWSSQGSVDPVSNLQGSKVYLFSGSADTTVKPGVMDALKTYYGSFVAPANVVYKKDIVAEHGMITDDFGNACSIKASPYINDCDFDLAGAMLAHFYGTLNPRNNAALPAGNFVEFKQSQFISNHGMATTGWAYIPQACTTGAQCRLHVVLHGCQQNVASVQQKYVRNTGYNRWADSNNIVMLYPQTSAQAVNSCWDWWGYDSVNYAKKSGPQMVAIKAMVDQVSSGGETQPTPPPTSTLPTPVGVTTSNATPNSVKISWRGVTGATGYNVYRGANKSNVLPVTASSFNDTGLAAATQYSWTVKALDAKSVESAASAAATGTTTGSSPPPPTAHCYLASNYSHTIAGRAYQLGGFTYANGSNQAMGWWNIFILTRLKMTGDNYYVIGTCP